MVVVASRTMAWAFTGSMIFAAHAAMMRPEKFRVLRV